MLSAVSAIHEIDIAQCCQRNSVQTSMEVQTTEIQYSKIVNWFCLFFTNFIQVECKIDFTVHSVHLNLINYLLSTSIAPYLFLKIKLT